MPFMDHFLEEVVVKHKNGLNRALYYFSWIIIVFSAIIASMTLGTLSTNFSWFSVILIVITGGVAVYTYFFHDKLLTEYEYTFTNGALDFAEVYNNKKRKSLGSLNVRNVEAFGNLHFHAGYHKRCFSMLIFQKFGTLHRRFAVSGRAVVRDRDDIQSAQKGHRNHIPRRHIVLSAWGNGRMHMEITYKNGHFPENQTSSVSKIPFKTAQAVYVSISVVQTQISSAFAFSRTASCRTTSSVRTTSGHSFRDATAITFILLRIVNQHSSL